MLSRKREALSLGVGERPIRVPRLGTGPRSRYRGQAFSVDALVALTIFTAIFLLYLNMADYLQQPRQGGFNEGFARGQRIAFTLTESAGIPYNWTAESFFKIGLSGGERTVLSEGKVYNFTLVNYSVAVEEMGVGDYNLRVRVLNATGSGMNVSNSTHSRVAELGNEPANSTLVVPIRRIATMNGQAVIVEITLWKQ